MARTPRPQGATRIAYFDCFHGISGDMVLGALVDAGLSLAWLRRELGSLSLEGYRLRSSKVRRGPLAATKVDVVLAKGRREKERRLRDIEALVRRAAFPDDVKAWVRDAFRRLAEAEARVHGTTPDKVHFHEVGAVDAIVDICGAMLGLHRLGVREAFAAPVPLGSGTVSTSHGDLPVPAPATVELLQGLPVAAGVGEGEVTTPTGAAILATLVKGAAPPPSFRMETVGYGAGSRDNTALPNALRIVMGDDSRGLRDGRGGIWQLEANLDDTTPEVLGHTLERLLEAGALDAWIAPVQMKKGRPGAVLGALVSGDALEAVAESVFLETPTFGLRCHPVERRVLDREMRRVRTPHGTVEVKIGRLDGRVVTVSPEFESCRRVAAKGAVAVREVFAAAVAAARKGISRSRGDGSA